MADRTPVQLITYDCPAEQVGAVLDIIEQYGLHPEHDEDGQPDDDQLGLGFTYMDSEVRCGSAAEIAQQLQESAPDASWEVWEDPKYEWLGDLYRFTPALGLWRAECSSEGDPLFTAKEIRNLVVEVPDAVDLLTGDSPLARELGETHERALQALAEKNDGVVLSRPIRKEDRA